MWTPSHRCSPFASLANEETVSTTAFCQCSVGENPPVLQPYRIRSSAVTSVGPDKHGGMRTQHRDLRTKALRSDAVVFLAPLIPLLPLIAAHPAEHERNALLVGEFDDVLAGDLRFPAQHIDAEILCIAQYVGLALGIVTIKQVWSVVSSARPEIPAVHLKVEVAAFTHVRKLLILVAMLGDAPDAET